MQSVLNGASKAVVVYFRTTKTTANEIGAAAQNIRNAPCESLTTILGNSLAIGFAVITAPIVIPLIAIYGAINGAINRNTPEPDQIPVRFPREENEAHVEVVNMNILGNADT